MARANYQILILSLIALFFMSACTGNEIEPNNPPVVATVEDILIINEGNFNQGNASLSLYNPNSKIIQHKVFENINNIGLGDVAQSATLINGDWWIVVNNSGKIEVIDRLTYELKHTITGFNSPRYVCLFNDKVYVTDLYADKITVVNPQTFKIESSFALPGWTEQIVSNENSIYVMNKDSNAIYKSIGSSNSFTKMDIDGTPIALVKSSKGIHILAQDGNNAIFYDSHNGRTLTMPGYSNLTNYAVDEKGETAYFINNKRLYSLDIFKISIRSIVDLKDKNIYALSSLNEDLYLSDAKDYVLKSDIFIYNSAGELIDEQKGGIITGGFAGVNN